MQIYCIQQQHHPTQLKSKSSVVAIDNRIYAQIINNEISSKQCIFLT